MEPDAEVAPPVAATRPQLGTGGLQLRLWAANWMGWAGGLPGSFKTTLRARGFFKAISESRGVFVFVLFSVARGRKLAPRWLEEREKGVESELIGSCDSTGGAALTPGLVQGVKPLCGRLLLELAFLHITVTLRIPGTGPEAPSTGLPDPDPGLPKSLGKGFLCLTGPGQVTRPLFKQ